MRFFIVALLLLILPMVALSQQIATPASFPLSHWFTTGSAVQYAPDISPALEARLKHTFLPSDFPEIDTLMDFRSIHRGESPEWNITPQQPAYFTPYFRKMSPFENQKMLVLPDSSNELKLWEPR